MSVSVIFHAPGWVGGPAFCLAVCVVFGAYPGGLPLRALLAGYFLNLSRLLFFNFFMRLVFYFIFFYYSNATGSI